MNRGKWDTSKGKLKIRKKIAINSIIVILITTSIGIGSKVIIEKNKKQYAVKSVSTNKEISKNEDLSNKKENVSTNQNIKETKLNNSGYLLLENDPNADDAVTVAENTKGLLNGTKQYPVRTDGKKVVYLTFDDGPSTTNTPAILDILDKYNVKATFFILGKSLEDNNDVKNILKDIAKNGHAIANHTYSHNYSYLYPNNTMNVDNIVTDIEKNNTLLKQVLGEDFSTRVIRFPGGYWSWEGRTPMRDKMVESNYYNVDWNALNKDAEGKNKNADELFEESKKTIEALGPNADSIVFLMHDTYGKEETVKVLPRIIEYLQGQGFEFRTIK